MMQKLKISLGLIALVTAAQAHAACMDSLSRLVAGSSAASAVTEASTSAIPASAKPMAAFQYPHPARAAGLLPVADWGFESPRIVGLWQFQLSGIDVDWGTQAWHSDGTELMFSAGQNPQTGDICQGVWHQIGPRTYTLNHIAMGWAAPNADPTKGAQFMRYHFHMVVTLDPRGQSFSGTYSLFVFMETANDPFNEDSRNNPPVASGTGAVTASRVNPDE